MNADDLKAYKQRWALVAEAERIEIERMTAPQKFADQAMLMALANGLTASIDEDLETAQVRRRWNLLAERMGV